ncbi:MAG: glycosyltransferase family 1 protein, partial [Candidatus Aminicenantales bacterium]
MKKWKRVGFVSTRIAGTDGVSLEIEKWTAVLERNGFRCFFFSGENDRPAEKCYRVDLAHFLHPEIQKIHKQCFGTWTRSEEITRKIHRIKDHLKKQLRAFLKQFEIELLIFENALSIPLNIPLGLAATEFVAETGFPCLAHHHDFFWERKRFLVNAVNDLLAWAFPPNLPSIQHVVINSLGSYQLSFRKGLSNTIIPNVYDFASPPKPVTRRTRKELR